MERIVEICWGSYYDAKNAYLGKAKRIELNSALYLGGLTPSTATLRQVKKDFDLEIVCMVRPRGAGFCYNDEDFLIMKEEAKDLLENGADGIAFGILDQDGNIDLKRNQEMIEIIKSYHKTSVFHRAFDCVKEISIFNRNDEFYDRAKLNVKNINEKTNCKASLFRLEDHEALEKEIKESVLFVNATNIGMHPLENQMILPDTHYLRKDLIVSDVIYSPEETLLLKDAKKIGCKTINGIGMMIYQGAEAFKLWTGMEMPIDTVKDALNLK